MQAVKLIIMMALQALEYVLPLLGKWAERNRRGKQAVAVLKTIREAEHLLRLYQEAQADGTLTPAETEWIVAQMQKVVDSLKEVVEWIPQSSPGRE